MRPNKFRARKADCRLGHNHASRVEAKRCNDLHLLQQAGEIAGLQVEPRFEFVIDGRAVKMRNGQTARYTPDFTYIERGVKVAEDVKGGAATLTEAAALRIALARHLWPDVDWRVVA